jgi:hypothetical protein
MANKITEQEIKIEIIEQPKSFEEELCSLINRYSQENGSNTPDFILRDYLSNCLRAFNKATNLRTKWYKYKI